MDIDYKKLILDKIKFGKLSDLTDSELLSVALDTVNKASTPLGVADSILSSYDGDMSQLFNNGSFTSVSKRCDISPKNVLKILAISEISRRIKPKLEDEVQVIRNREDVKTLFGNYFTNVVHEEFWAVYLNNGNRVIDKKKCADGNIHAVAIDAKILIRHALNTLATKIVLVHNHPSGDLTPSQKDIELTKKIENAAALFDISVLDHLIIAPCGDYRSLNEPTP